LNTLIWLTTLDQATVKKVQRATEGTGPRVLALATDKVTDHKKNCWIKGGIEGVCGCRGSRRQEKWPSLENALE